MSESQVETLCRDLRPQLIGRTNTRAASCVLTLNLGPRVFVPLLVLGLTLYVLLASSAWQTALPLPWLRMGIAWLLFLTPGWILQQLLWRGANVTFSQRLVVGGGVAVTLGAAFGLLATALQAALWFVIGALTLTTIVGALFLAVRQNWQWRGSWRVQIARSAWFIAAPMLLACLVVMRLTYGLAFDADDFTYAAYVTHWLEATRFDWLQLPLAVSQIAPSRFWLAYWPLNQAALAQWSMLHPIELTRLYLAPGLALGALGANYALARAFGMGRAASGFALTLQAAALLWLTAQDQAGFIFFNRLDEDKAIASFFLIPILAIVVTAFLKQPARGLGVLLVLAGIGLTLTHPVITAVAAAAVILFALLSTIPTRAWRPLGVILLVLALTLSAPLLMRFFDATYTDKIPFAVETLLRKDQLRRVLEWGGGVYSLHPSVYWGLPFLWILAGVGAALWELKTSYAARWILASALIFLSVINPLTIRLWEFAISSSLIWRVLWFMPFGIAAAYLACFVWRRAVPVRWKKESVADVALALSGTVILLAALGLVWRNASPLEALKPKRAAKQAQFTDLLALKPVLEAELPEPAVVVGSTRRLTDGLPAVSAKARVFAFRTVVNMWQLGGLEWQDAQARVNARRKLEAAKTSAAERLAILEKYEARLIVSKTGTAWMYELMTAAPERIQYIGTYGALELYRIQP